MVMYASGRISSATASRFADSCEAVSRAVGFLPALSSSSAGWNSLALYAWRGHCERAHFQPLPEPTLVYHTGGAPVVKIRRGRSWSEPSRPGLLTVIPAGTPVDWVIDGDVHSYSVHLGSDFFSTVTGVSSQREPLRFRCGVVDPLLAAAITALADELARPAQRGSLYADAIADMMTLHLLRGTDTPAAPATSSGGLSRQQLRHTLELLESSVESGISLQALAGHAGLSRTYFAEAFQRTIGRSPHRYLTQRRIARAQTLLQHTGMPLSEIALQCGFSSQAHFSQSFRQHTGTTPGRYRLELR